jgi:hypothetical protein
MSMANSWQEASEFLSKRRYKKSNSRPIAYYVHLVAYNEQQTEQMIHELYQQFKQRRVYHVSNKFWNCPCGHQVKGETWSEVARNHNPILNWFDDKDTEHYHNFTEWWRYTYSIDGYMSEDDFKAKLRNIFKPSDITTNTYGSIHLVRYKTSWRPFGYLLGSLNPDDTKTIISPYSISGPSDRYYYNLLLSDPSDTRWGQTINLNIKRYQYKMYLRTKHMGVAPTGRGKCSSCVNGVSPSWCTDPDDNTATTNYSIDGNRFCKHGSRIIHRSWSDLETCRECSGTGKKSQLAMSEWFGLPLTFDSDMNLIDSFDIDNLSTLKNFSRNSIAYPV